MSRLGLILVLGSAAAACAGGGPARPAARATLCEIERSGLGAVAPETWVALLVPGHDPRTRLVTSPVLDCTGAQARWEAPALDCADGALARTARPDRPLAASDVVETEVDRAASLVWVATTSYASGDAAGPVALVARSASRLRVVASGVLRAYPRNAALRLERIGAAEILVAEGDACGRPEAGPCARVARLVPLVGGRFVPAPLAGEDGRCASPALVDLRRSERRSAVDGWELAELTAALAFGAEGLVIQEQLVVHELGERGQGAPLRVVRRAQSTRAVSWRESRLVAAGAPLWSRLSQRRWRGPPR